MIRTTMLLASLTGLFLGVGYMMGGQSGMVLAFGMAVLMNVGTYLFSDKIVLRMHNAREADSKTYSDLIRMTRELAHNASLPMPKLYVYRDATPNAFATGRDEHHAVVAVSSGILSLLSRAELRGVVAHELAHIKNKDMLLSTIAATLAGAVSMLAEFAYGLGAMFMPRSSDDEGPNPIAGVAIAIVAPMAAMLIQMAVSRGREFLADETGAIIAKDPLSLASALRKLGDFAKHGVRDPHPTQLATAHLYISNPFKGGGLVSLFSTHPPMEERIARLSALKV